MPGSPFACWVAHRECRGRRKNRGFGVANFSVCTATTTMTPLMAQNLDDKGEITEAIKSFQRGLASEEEERRSSQNMEEQSGQNKVIETAFRLEQAMEKMSLITKLTGGGIGASRSMKAGQKKNACWVASRRQRPYGTTWYETIKEEGKLQSNKDVTVQCIDFCEVTTSDVHAVF